MSARKLVVVLLCVVCAAEAIRSFEEVLIGNTRDCVPLGRLRLTKTPHCKRTRKYEKSYSDCCNWCKAEPSCFSYDWNKVTRMCLCSAGDGTYIEYSPDHIIGKMYEF